MQTPAEQHQANIERIGAYHRRCCAWLKAAPAQFAERLADLDRRYCRGRELKRQWRAPPAADNLIPFPPRSTP